MDYVTLIDEYRVEGPYDEWFLEEGVFRGDLRYDGWKLLEAKPLHTLHKEFNDSRLVMTNPNFYEDGHVLAESRRSVVMASGLGLQFIFKGEEFDSFFTLFSKYGPDVIGMLDEIEWLETKDWIIINKKSNELLAQFDYWPDAPTRKQVE